jgi:redox-regulated HSP33 family molecular chaperone
MSQLDPTPIQVMQNAVARAAEKELKARKTASAVLAQVLPDEDRQALEERLKEGSPLKLKPITRH